MQTTLVIGDLVKAINIKPLPGNKIAPPLVLQDGYEVKGIIRTIGDHDHIDVGLESNHGFISCHATGEPIPNGDKIHWCHPSRFELIRHLPNE